MLRFLNWLIRFGFYGIFLLVPLALWPDTSELFEFNKLWVTFILTLIIGAAWISKMILRKKIIFQRTPLDIPIAFFLLSQIISTIFSIDHHVSIWGYYSRFNGGLLSIIDYIFLYFAFVSNLFNHEHTALSNQHEEAKNFVFHCLRISLVSGLIVALWGLPAHFGYDPTCFIFRGQLNVDCWTAAFQPKVRIFSTLGQPDWLAAYLSILIPIALAFGFQKTQNTQKSKNSDIQTTRQSDNLIHRVFRVFRNPSLYCALLALLFYIDFLYSRSKGSFIAQIVVFIVFLGGLLYLPFRTNPLFANHETEKSHSQKTMDKTDLSTRYRLVGITTLAIFLITFIIGTPFVQLDKFTLKNVTQSISQILSSHPIQNPKPIVQNKQTASPAIAGELGGTDSGKIRYYVWQGALAIWLHNPLFGTGVETFAFAYYRYRPAGHNMTSEWDYLYNKAHNEYLNYLATTGIFGLGSYLAIIVTFLFLSFKSLHSKIENQISIELHNSHDQNTTQFEHSNLIRIYVLALISAFISLLISNFFGFSVVIVNIYFFLIPAFVFVLTDKLKFTFQLTAKKTANNELTNHESISLLQKTAVCITWITAFYLIVVLCNYWQADREYGLGQNLDRISAYAQAQPHLQYAAKSRPGEPVFQDELAVNDAAMAIAYARQKDINSLNMAQQLADQALQINKTLVTQYPNNVVFWKNRVRILYILSQINPQYLTFALKAIQYASILAPTDAKISYNLALLYAQNGRLDKAISVLRNTIRLKPDYRDAYYALGILLHQEAMDKTGKTIVNEEKEKEAVKTLKFLITKISPGDEPAIKALKSWGKI